MNDLRHQNCTKLNNLEILSVKRSARRKGEEKAMPRGCWCGKVFESNNYSAKIFTKIGWTETGRLRYEDLVSDEGR